MSNKIMTRYDKIMGGKPARTRQNAGTIPIACRNRSAKPSATSKLLSTLLLLLLMVLGGANEAWGQSLPSLTTSSNTYLYKINLAISSGTYLSNYFITPSSPKVSIKDNPGNNELWYVIETDDTPTGTFTRDHIAHYCYIVNALSGEYLYYTGTNSNSIETNVVEMKAIDAENVEADRFKFIIKRSGNGSTPNYWMFPKIAAENNNTQYESNSYGFLALGVPQGNASYTNGSTLSKEKNGVWTSQWVFVSALLFDAPAITFNSGTNQFTISHNVLSSGCTIYYTTDNSTPSSLWTPYTGAVDVSNSETVRAVVIRDDIVLTEVGSLTVSPAVEAPVITNNFDGTISLSCTTPGTVIYYTKDGSTPDNNGNGTQYTTAFSLGNATIIKAIAYNSAGTFSSSVTTYNVPQYDAPTISFNSATSQVTINGLTGATIYYTTDGGTPTTSSTAYSAPFSVTSNTVVKAIATHAGYLASETATQAIITEPSFQYIPDFSYVYDGTEKEPIDHLEYSSTTIPSTAYLLTYTNNQNAGTATVTITDSGVDDGLIVYGSTTFTITQKAITITAASETRVYDGTPLTNDGYTCSPGLATGDSFASVTVTGSQTDVNSSANVPSDAVIKNGSNEVMTGNYDITYADGTLTVTQKEVGLSWGTTTLNYTGSPQVPTVTVTGLVNDDEIGVTVTGGQTEIGTGYIATASELTGEKAGNYSLPAENTIEFSIRTATLTVTANNHTIIYGDARPNYDVVYEGFVNGDNASMLSGKLTYTCDYARGKDVGTYTITPKGLRSDKYEIEFVAGTLTVNPKEVGLSWGTTELTYTGVVQAPTATATGLVNDDEIDVTVEGGQTYVGVYTATATALTGTKKDNYTLPTANTTSFSIVEAPLTVTANNQTITYGDAPADDGVTYTGFVNNETLSVLGGELAYTYDYNRYDNIVRYNENDEVVPYTITPGGLTATNYAITFQAGTLTVNPKEVRLTWDESSFACDGAPHAPTPTINSEDLVNSDNVTVTVTVSANTGSSLTGGNAVNAGYYRATASLTGTKAGNYKPVPAIQPFTISFKMIGDGNDPAVGITIVTTDGSSVTVTDGETTLSPDTDYTSETTIQGDDHHITVTGKGNYSGSAQILYVTTDFNRPTGDETKYAAVYQAKSDLAKPTGITPCIIERVNPSAGTLIITPVGYLPADVPVVLVAASDISGFQASAKPDNVTAITDQTKNSNLLKVSPTEGVTVAATQIYLFNAGEFVLTMSGTLPAGYFYLDNPNYHTTGTSGGSSRLRLVLEDATAIEAPQLSTLDFQLSTDTWYTLDGRKLNGIPTQKGLYIVNGKKVIIK